MFDNLSIGTQKLGAEGLKQPIHVMNGRRSRYTLCQLYNSIFNNFFFFYSLLFIFKQLSVKNSYTTTIHNRIRRWHSASRGKKRVLSESLFRTVQMSHLKRGNDFSVVEPERVLASKRNRTFGGLRPNLA